MDKLLQSFVGLLQDAGCIDDAKTVSRIGQHGESAAGILYAIDLIDAKQIDAPLSLIRQANEVFESNPLFSDGIGWCEDIISRIGYRNAS